MPLAVPVRLFDCHDEAYHAWSAARVRARRLVHVDAHHDVSWVGSTEQMHIGNYICQAIRDGIVRELFWIVPDRSFAHRPARRELLRQLRALKREYRAKGRLERGSGWIRLDLGGCRLTVCELDDLPVSGEPALLDVDTDFLVSPPDSFRIGRPASSPWILPAALVARLRQRVTPELITIAYSVEGGYTPIVWRFLGDELAFYFSAGNDPDHAAAFADIRVGQELLDAGDLPAAEAACRRAIARLHDPAAAWFLLARVLRAAGRLEEAAAANAEARRLQPAYASPYSSGGFVWLEHGRFVDAEREFRYARSIDPCDGFAAVGLTRVALERRAYEEAIAWADQAIAVGQAVPDACRGKARALSGLGRVDEAIVAYQESLRRSLAGEPMIRRVIAARRTTRLPIEDRDHARVHAELARLEARRGRTASAIAGLRLAVSAGDRRPQVLALLAILYVRQRRLGRAAASLSEMAGQLLPHLHSSMQRAIARARMRLEALAG